VFGEQKRLEHLEEAVRALIKVVDVQNHYLLELLREFRKQRASSGAVIKTLGK
jgi:hypothetical protein